MRLAVDASREPADDHEPGSGELAPERPRNGGAVGRARACPDDRDRRPVEQPASPPPRRNIPTGGSKIAGQRSRERRRRAGEPANTPLAKERGDSAARRTCARTARTRRARLREHVGARLGRERGNGELAHASSSLGVRYESASATCSGQTPSAPASAAIVRATRATRARPRPESGSRSTARVEQLVGRRRAREAAPREQLSRACDHALATAAEGSAGGAASSCARGRGTVTTRSKRSSSARESLSRKAASRCAEHEHSTAGSPRPPHGQRFIVATSWKRAGKSAMPWARAMLTIAVLERLAQRLERRPHELGQLVEQQDAAVREARLAGPRAGPPPTIGRDRGTVVRRAERRRDDERPAGRQQAGHRVDARDLERLVRRERRQDAGQPAREHRLARSRRAREQEVVTSSGGDLERTPPSLLPADVGEIRVQTTGRRLAVRRLERRRLALAAQVRGGLGEVAKRHGLDAGKRGLGGRVGRAEEPLEPALAALLPRRRARRPPAARGRRARARRRQRARRSRSRGIWCDAASTARAIGRSKPEPSLRRPAGARFTVIRCRGHSRPAAATLERTRCFASWHARSARPTIVKPGRPLSTFASTSTRRASRPTRAWVTVRASTRSNVAAAFTRYWSQLCADSRALGCARVALADRRARRPRRARPVRRLRVQQPRPRPQRGRDGLGEHRRPAAPPRRPDPEPRRGGQGLRRARARGLRRGDAGAGRRHERLRARRRPPGERRCSAPRSAGCSPSRRRTRSSAHPRTSCSSRRS